MGIYITDILCGCFIILIIALFNLHNIFGVIFSVLALIIFVMYVKALYDHKKRQERIKRMY